MAIDTAYSILGNAFENTMVFNIGWIISLAITAISLVLITRNSQKWRILAFPVMLGWHVAGIAPNFIIYLASALMFAIEGISIQTLGDIITIAKRQTMTTITDIQEKVATGTEWGREKTRQALEKETKIKEIDRAIKLKERKQLAGQYIKGKGRIGGMGLGKLKKLKEDIEEGRATKRTRRKETIEPILQIPHMTPPPDTVGRRIKEARIKMFKKEGRDLTKEEMETKLNRLATRFRRQRKHKNRQPY